MKTARLWALCVALTLITACGGDTQPTPTATSAPPTPTVVAQPPSPEVATPTTSSPSESAVVSATSPVSIDVAADVPLVSAEGGITTSASTAPICSISTSADFGGYEDPTVELGCPQAEATFDPVGINEFGEGPDYNRFMLWFGSEQQIYVLLPDGTWLAYTDTWKEEEPEIACNPSDGPMTSPPLPRRGFGKLWCTVEGVREQMGEIDREERLCQHAVTQRFDNGRLLACYEDATIRYFRILNDGAWQMEMVQ